MAELFTEPAADPKSKPGSKVKALKTAPPGANKQMKKTVGSQVRELNLKFTLEICRIYCA